MLQTSQPLSRPLAANLWEDLQAASVLLSQVGVAQCTPYPPLPMPMP